MERENVYAGGGGLVWHPAIRALGWLRDWIIWATCAGVLWEFLAMRSSLSWLGSVVARTGAVCAALVCSVIPVILFDNWLAVVERARREYPVPWFSTVVILVASSAFVMVGSLYGWLVQWTLRWLWPLLWRLAANLPQSELSPLFVPTWVALALLIVGSCLAFVSLRPFVPKHLRVWRLLGLKKTLKGYGVMALLRLRQPRKDFFAQAPLVSAVPSLAIAAVLHRIIPLEFVSWTLPLLLVATSVSKGLDMLLPPAWLFLGRSDFDSFRTFDILRSSWPLFGVTLLNRDSKAWHAYYLAFAEEMARRGCYAARFMNKPRTPRVWSLRSRDDLWESTVMRLMDLAPVVVVDARVKSYFVFDEILWLAELEWIDKAWLLGQPDATAQALDGALAWADDDNVVLPTGVRKRLAARVVTEEQLYASSWTAYGLEIDRSDGVLA